jgi:fucose permease
MIVPASALYREAGYRTGLILALLTLAVLLTLEMYWLPWG